MTVACLARDADATRSTSSTALAPDGHSTLSVSLGLPAGSEFSLELDLYDAAVPGTAILSVRAPRTEVRFEKAATARYMWPALERVAGSSAPLPPQPAAMSSTAAPVSSNGGGGVPTVVVTDEAGGGSSVSGGGSTAASASIASKSKTKDWNKLEKELKDEEEAAGEGEEALMKLFRNIYTGADENTRRAMVKSFQTSGGTVLSTNWGEVAKEDYEKNLKPPEGMEFVKEK